MTKEELDFYSRYIDRDRLEYIERQSELFEAAKTDFDRPLSRRICCLRRRPSARIMMLI